MSTEPTQRPRLDATIAAINSICQVPPQAFLVGDHQNVAGENKGSLAIFGFAKRYGLREDQVPSMFCEATEEVLADPSGTSHPNIRAFLKHGLAGVELEFGSDSIQLNSTLRLIEAAWDARASFSPNSAPPDVRDAVDLTLRQLDAGAWRVAMQLGDTWVTTQAVKKAVLLSFRLNDNEVLGGRTFRGELHWFDKVRSKFENWGHNEFQAAGLRVVPGAIVRHGSFIGKNVVLMPSFVNIGAYVGDGTMIDAWATVGSCAQIGKNCHLSGGVGIGGVLEPLQSNPTIIGDNCFIGARSEIVEGVIVEDNCVISMGVYIGQSTKIYDRTTGEVTYGRIPEGSVVVSGNLPSADGKYSLYCAVIVKKVDAQTRAKTSLNDLLRD